MITPNQSKQLFLLKQLKEDKILLMALKSFIEDNEPSPFSKDTTKILIKLLELQD